jgi:hypothetical protein
MSRDNYSNLWKLYIRAYEAFWGTAITKHPYPLTPEMEQDLGQLLEIIRDAFAARWRGDFGYMQYQCGRYAAIACKYLDPPAQSDNFGTGEGGMGAGIPMPGGDGGQAMRELGQKTQAAGQQIGGLPKESGQAATGTLGKRGQAAGQESSQRTDHALQDLAGALPQSGNTGRKVSAKARQARAKNQAGDKPGLQELLEEINQELEQGIRKSQRISAASKKVTDGIDEGDDRKVMQGLQEMQQAADETAGEAEPDTGIQGAVDQIRRYFHSGDKDAAKDTAAQIDNENNIDPSAADQARKNLQQARQGAAADFSRTRQQVVEKLKQLGDALEAGRAEKFDALKRTLDELQQAAQAAMDAVSPQEGEAAEAKEQGKLDQISQQIKALEEALRQQAAQAAQQAAQEFEEATATPHPLQPTSAPAKPGESAIGSAELDALKHAMDELIEKLKAADKAQNTAELEKQLQEIMQTIETLEKQNAARTPKPTQEAIEALQKKLADLRKQMSNFNPYDTVADDVDYTTMEAIRYIQERRREIRRLQEQLELGNLADAIDTMRKRLEAARRERDTETERRLLEQIFESLKDVAEEMGREAYTDIVRRLGVTGDIQYWEDLTPQPASDTTGDGGAGRGVTYGARFTRPSLVDIMFYRSIAQRYEIKFHRAESAVSLSGEGGVEKMSLDDPLEQLDVYGTLHSRGSLSPDGWLKTPEVEYETGSAKKADRTYPDLLLVIDSSGSMGVSQGKYSEHITSGMIAAHSAVNVGRQVIIINHSTGTSGEVTYHNAPTQYQNEIDDVLAGHFNGGTTFPHAVFKEALQKLSGKVYVIYITDTYIDVGPTKATLREALELDSPNPETRKVMGWSIFVEPVTGKPVEQVIQEFKELGPGVYRADPETLRGKTLEIIQRHFGQERDLVLLV